MFLFITNRFPVLYLSFLMRDEISTHCFSVTILSFMKGDQLSLHANLIPAEIDDFAKSHPCS